MKLRIKEKPKLQYVSHFYLCYEQDIEAQENSFLSFTSNGFNLCILSDRDINCFQQI